MDWAVLVLVALLVVWVGPHYIPPHWWYASAAKRRAMRLGVQAARQLHGAEVIWPRCFIRRCDREKCFVFLQHKSQFVRPEAFSVFAVRFATGRVDDLGAWQFHWGLFHTGQPMDAYEECRARGEPWPVGVTEWVRWAKERGKGI